MKILISFLLFVLFLISFRFSFASDHIIISQFQVSGVSATDEFIELYNPTNKDIDLFDYKIQKRSSSGASYNIISSIPEKSIIKAFSYFLIAHQNFSLKSYIVPDLTYSTYSIANDNSIVIYNADSDMVDVVGYGNCVVFEGSCIANLSSGQSFIRTNDYNNYGIGYGYGLNNSFNYLCSDFDLNDNKKDFFVLDKSSPRNSSFKNECKYIPSITQIDFNNINNNSNNQSSAVSTQSNNTPPQSVSNNSFENIFIKENLKNYNNAIQQNNINDIKDVLLKNNDVQNDNVVVEQPILPILQNKTPTQNKIIQPMQQNNIVDISDIQNLNIGDTISLYGTVISVPGEFSDKYFYLNGAQVYNSSGNFPKLIVGDKIFVSGIISSNYGEKRIKIKNLNDIKIISKNNKIESLDLINSEEEINNLIANFVFISGVISRKNANKVYILNDDIETEIYFNEKLKEVYKILKLGDNVKIFGVLNKRNDSYRIIPRNDKDVEIIKENIIPEDSNNVQAAGIVDSNKMTQNVVSAQKIISTPNAISVEKNNKSLKSYSVKNNNYSKPYFKYVVLTIIFMIVFIGFVYFYKVGILLKIKMFFKILANKFINSGR